MGFNARRWRNFAINSVLRLPSLYKLTQYCGALRLNPIHRHAANFCVLLLTGCATYHAEILPSAPANRQLDQLAAAVNESETLTQPDAHPGTRPGRLPNTRIDLTAPLNGLDIARLALLANPELNAARADAKIADAQVFAAGLVPDPQISLGFERPERGEALVNGNSVALALDLLHLGRAKSLASQLAAQKKFELAWLEWLTANQARSVVLKIQSLSAQADLAQAALAQAQENVSAADTLLAAGDQKIDENALRHVALLDTSARSLSLARECASARRALNALLGLAPAQHLNLLPLAASIADKLPDAAQLLRKSLEQRPDLLGLRAAYAASDSQLQIALSAQYPLPQISLTRARDTGNVHSSSFGVSWSVPLWNRGRGVIAIAEATRAQLAQAYAARLGAIAAEQAELLASLPSATQERAALNAQLATLNPQLAALTQALERGDIELARVEPIRAAVLDQQLKLIALEASVQDLQIQLETSTGQRLWPTP